MRSTLKYIAIAMAVAMGARAAPPVGADLNSPLAQWYKSLHAPTGGACCGIADCRPVQARRAEDHWEILIGTHWESVPEGRVLRRQGNMDGRPIACLGMVDDGLDETIVCFIPPPET